jgi:hypothetical protein
VKGPASNLIPSQDGNFAVALTGAEPTLEPGAPQDIVLGSLWLVPAGTGAPRRLGGEVSNLAGSVLFSPDSAFVAFLGGYSVRHGAGELRMTRTTGGEVESLGDGVTFFAFSAQGEWIAWVSDGTLFLRRSAGGATTRVTDGVSLVEFGPKDTPAAGQLLIKRSVRAGGALLMDELATGKLTAIARGVTAFDFSPTGDGFAFEGTGLLAPTLIERPVDPGSGYGGADATGLYRVTGHDAPHRLTTVPVTDFKFSPASARLAFLSLPSSGSAGDLFITDGGAPERVSLRVSEMQFAPDGSLAFIGAYDAGTSAGTLGVLPPKGPFVQISQNVRQFSISPKGGYVLYSRQIFRNAAFSLGFAVQPLAAPAPASAETIEDGVFGYAADATDTHLAFKAHCMSGGKSCALYFADLATPTKHTQIASGVGAFEFGPGGLVIVSTRREENLTGKLHYALGYVLPQANAPVQTLDDQMSGEFVLMGPQKRRVIYLAGDGGQEGVFAVNLEGAPAGKR